MDKLYERICLAVTIIARLLRNGVPLIAEGIGHYPKRLEQVTSPQQVVYFIADEGGARKTWIDRYENTPWLEGCSEPEQIIEMFINRTALHARYIQERTRRLGFTSAVGIVLKAVT